MRFFGYYRLHYTLQRILLLAVVAVACRPAAAQPAGELASEVTIRRTTYGVPHIEAENLRAGAFGMAYLQLEDYGRRVPEGLIEARGEMALHEGSDHLDSDFVNRQRYARAVETYSRLPEDVRAIYEGFAAGVNHYIRLHPDEFPDWMDPDFTGYDVLARGVRGPQLWRVNDFVERIERRGERAARVGDAAPRTPWALAARGAEPPPAGYGSNSWALAPSRTESGDAILVRNPHLGWDAGYYEAQMTVPGEFNFYGDFRVGGPFATIGGFNEHLGWSTSNNSPDLDQIYALEADPERPDHYRFNGASLPIQREDVTVRFKNGEGTSRETRTFLSTPLGPVIHRGGGKIYVYRAAGLGEYRSGLQLLRMMRADDLAEWKEAMSMRADVNSNYIYADDQGNIYHVWNASTPEFPQATADSVALDASSTSDVWTQLVPFDALPQLKNPEGGYVLNSNDSFHYTNLNEIMEPEVFPSYFPEPEFDLRSQLSAQLIGGKETLSLEEVVRRKHSTRMLLADRVKPDLIEAMRASEPTGEVARAIERIEQWDNTVAAESRGSVLFARWWRRYVERVDSSASVESPFAAPWHVDAPTNTPRGLAAPALAVEAFEWALEETERRWGRWDAAWGEVHRARRGEVDAPVGGCTGRLGCFRVLWYEEADDGTLVADGGDGWVLAVAMSDPPRAYSILANGQSNRPESPHYDAQLERFARGEMKRVAFTPEQIEENLLRRYHPGEEPGTPEQ
jgi:acyl-homoserine-lactone acylase